MLIHRRKSDQFSFHYKIPVEARDSCNCLMAIIYLAKIIITLVSFCCVLHGRALGMVTSEYMEVSPDGRFATCNPVDYKVPNVSSIPRQFNVTLLKNHDYVTTCYSSKVYVLTFIVVLLERVRYPGCFYRIILKLLSVYYNTAAG